MLIAVAALPSGAGAQSTLADPTTFASADNVTAELAAMERAMKPGQGFAWRPLVSAGSAVAALEIWKKPGRPAVHPDEAEYAVVISGAGTLVSGGTLVDPVVVKPGLTDGARIIGGTTRQLAKGDVVLIPAGVPHWFGIAGSRLVLLGTKLRTRP